MKEASKKTKQMGIHDRQTVPYNKSKELHKSNPTRAPERNRDKADKGTYACKWKTKMS